MALERHPIPTQQSIHPGSVFEFSDNDPHSFVDRRVMARVQALYGLPCKNHELFSPYVCIRIINCEFLFDYNLCPFNPKNSESGSVIGLPHLNREMKIAAVLLQNEDELIYVNKDHAYPPCHS